MLIQENIFVRDSNYYYKLDYLNNSLSTLNMAIKERFYNLFFSNV